MLRICILSFTPVATDPRVLRQIQTLRALSEVTLVGYGTPPESPVDFRSVLPRLTGVWARTLPKFVAQATSSLLLVLGLNKLFYWTRPYTRQAFRSLRGERFDLVIANNFETVPLAKRLSRGLTPIILDAQEFTPDEFPDGWLTRMFSRYRSRFLVKSQAKNVNKVFTVSKKIADAYESEFGLTNVELLLNVPGYQELAPSRNESEPIRLIHHGICTRGRNLEKTIEAMRQLQDRFSLTLMLMPSDPAYLAELKVLASGLPVEFIAPVPTIEIPRELNKHDIGVFLHNSDTFNATHCLPNKFFEYIQGRLAIAIGPSPEMAAITNENNLGVVTSEFTTAALVEALSGLTRSRVDAFKENSHAVATSFCWEVEAVKLVGAVNLLTRQSLDLPRNPLLGQ